MGIFIRDITKLWPNAVVPYECHDDPWAIKLITAFNRELGRTLFIPRSSGKPDYVVFEQRAQGSCQIGRQGGRQLLSYHQNDYSIKHEMGHCLGLGHEFFHPGWPHRQALLGYCPCQTYEEMNRCITQQTPHGGKIKVDATKSLAKLMYLKNLGKYEFVGGYDSLSIMNYNADKLGFPNRGYIQPTMLSKGDISLILFKYPNAIP